MEQFKVLSRFSRYLSVEAAVSDIPAPLQKAINKHWYEGMRGFVKNLYSITRMDLNSLTPEVKTFKRLSQSEIDKITKDDGVLVIVFNYKGSEGVLLLNYHSTDFYQNGREMEGLYIGNSFYRILGRPRNVVTLINKPEVEYTAWAFYFPSGSVMDKVREREARKKGMIRRVPEKFRNNWMKEYDKNGYELDKHKYRDMLQKIREEGGLWAKRLDAAMRDFLQIQSDILAAKKIDDLRYELRDTMKKLNEAAMKSLDTFSTDKDKKAAFDSIEKALSNLKARMKKEGIVK